MSDDPELDRKVELVALLNKAEGFINRANSRLMAVHRHLPEAYDERLNRARRSLGEVSRTILDLMDELGRLK